MANRSCCGIELLFAGAPLKKWKRDSETGSVLPDNNGIPIEEPTMGIHEHIWWPVWHGEYNDNGTQKIVKVPLTTDPIQMARIKWNVEHRGDQAYSWNEAHLDPEPDPVTGKNVWRQVEVTGTWANWAPVVADATKIIKVTFSYDHVPALAFKRRFLSDLNWDDKLLNNNFDVSFFDKAVDHEVGGDECKYRKSDTEAIVDAGLYDCPNKGDGPQMNAEEICDCLCDDSDDGWYDANEIGEGDETFGGSGFGSSCPGTEITQSQMYPEVCGQDAGREWSYGAFNIGSNWTYEDKPTSRRVYGCRHLKEDMKNEKECDIKLKLYLSLSGKKVTANGDWELMRHYATMDIDNGDNVDPGTVSTEIRLDNVHFGGNARLSDAHGTPEDPISDAEGNPKTWVINFTKDQWDFFYGTMFQLGSMEKTGGGWEAVHPDPTEVSLQLNIEAVTGNGWPLSSDKMIWDGEVIDIPQ